jgi:hypothetical protein
VDGGTLARRIKFLMGALQELQRAIAKVGIGGTLSLIIEKRRKKQRVTKVLASSPKLASLRPVSIQPPQLTPEEEQSIIEKADAMLRDENFFFSFRYKTRDVEDIWNFDPIESKYWPKRHYEETRVHAADTPRDVKIIWEINRFKDLPILAQAAYITKEKKYADDIERRLQLWIEDNPFGKTVNWSSPLELAIRIISWVTSLRLLSAAGFAVHEHGEILKSIWQHAVYLGAALSTDKIVRSNHLIGETAGLYVVSALCEFDESASLNEKSKNILEDSVIKQTYSDGASRESSGWYHGFVTDFAEIALRVGTLAGDKFSDSFSERLALMILYKNSIIASDGAIAKFGDFDNGKALDLPTKWRDVVLGVSSVSTTERKNYFPDARHITAKIETNSLFVRAGEFGWGGSGFSSHAHDDFLAPAFVFHRHQILVDPGTYVYNGDPESRDEFRVATAHNTIIIGESTGAELKPSFGWKQVRPDASIDFFSESEEEIIAEASFGEWRGEHLRRFRLTKDLLSIEEQKVTWHFHFHPRWRIETSDGKKFALHDFRGSEFLFELSSVGLEFEIRDYSFSPSYMEKSPGKKVIFTITLAPGAHHYKFEITRPS